MGELDEMAGLDHGASDSDAGRHDDDGGFGEMGVQEVEICCHGGESEGGDDATRAGRRDHVMGDPVGLESVWQGARSHRAGHFGVDPGRAQSGRQLDDVAFRATQRARGDDKQHAHLRLATIQIGERGDGG